MLSPGKLVQMNVQDSGIGGRVKLYRRRRGLSQAALAGLVGRSESWLSQVERGVRAPDKLSVVADLARVLGIDPTELIGARPWALAPNGGFSAAADLDQLRAALMHYELLTGVVSAPDCTADDLRAAVNQGSAQYQAAQYDVVLRRLPALLSQADRLRSTSDAPSTLFAYVTAYVLAAKLTSKLGAADMAQMTADRAATAAGLASDSSLTAVGLAAFQVANAQLRADRPEHSEAIAVGVAERLTAAVRPDDPVVVSLAGAMWLIAAVIAARRTERVDAWHRLDRAEALASMLGEDGNYAQTAFGPTNVALHRVSVAAELGDAGEAVRLAALVDTDRFPRGLLSRRAQLSLDLAWAQNQRRHDAEAILHLLEAERVAPETIRHNSVAREIVRELLSRGNTKTQTRALADLGARAGIVH